MVEENPSGGLILGGFVAAAVAGAIGVAYLASRVPSPPPPSALSVRLVSIPPSCTGDCQVVVSASVSGGSGPYNYAWTVDGRSVGGNTPSLVLTLSAGSLISVYTVSVTVSGPTHAAGTAAIRVVVAPAGGGMLACTTCRQSETMPGVEEDLESPVTARYQGGQPIRYGT